MSHFVGAIWVQLWSWYALAQLFEVATVGPRAVPNAGEKMRAHTVFWARASLATIAGSLAIGWLLERLK